MLKTIEAGSLNLRVWNPEVSTRPPMHSISNSKKVYPQDRAHLMPIITPAFPSMCATHNVMHTTKDIMLKEFKRAEELLNFIQDGKKGWPDLFSPSTFFTKDHKYYLSVIAASRASEGGKEHDAFAGLVTSKVRVIVKGIEDGDAGIDLARLYPHAFDRIHQCETEDQIDRIKQGSLDYLVKKDTVAAGGESSNGESAKKRHTIHTSTFYIGLTLPEVSEGISVLPIFIKLF